MKTKVIIIGPAHPLRGGLASFDQRLCKEFMDLGYDCSIFSFSLQYPSFLFPGTTQYTNEPAPKDLKIYSVINSIHPLNWIHNGNQIKNLRPHLVVVRFWLPFMGPALGTILRKVKKNGFTKIVAITDNIIPHEKRPGDIPFTRYFLNSCDAFITMSEKVMQDLRRFVSDKPARKVIHPLYDNFGDAVDKTAARKKLGIDLQKKILLFFGFIRKYKGLDLLLQAIPLLKQEDSRFKNSNLQVLIAGEFYEDEKPYRELIAKYGIENDLVLRTEFIPDSEVKYYLCAADAVVQPYRNATQSGVTPLAYHFEKPMIVTNVGGLPTLVLHEKTGIVCEPNAGSIARAIGRFFELGEDYFLPHLRKEKEKYSWKNLVDAIETVANEV